MKSKPIPLIRYESLFSDIYGKLSELKKLMDSEEFTDLIEDPGTPEELLGCVYGDFYLFVLDLQNLDFNI